jgi:hypothetical protein
MSATSQRGPLEGMARGKLDEEDHDLLTFNEADERLRIEIALSTASVAELEKSGASDELEKARARLTALRAAATRHAARPINDTNFEEFFGYRGKARSNLVNPPTE